MGYIIEPADHSWLVAFVNEYATAAWAARGSVETYRSVEELGAAPLMAAHLSFRELTDTADQIYQVVAAETDSARVHALNALIEPADPTVSVVLLDELTSVVVSESEDSAALLALACGLALTELIESVGVERMGTCEAPKCDRVYVDRSPRGSRSFCSQKCQTRVRVARHRAKRATEAA